MSPRIAGLGLAVVALFGLTACTGSPTATTTAGSSTPGASRESDEPGDSGQSTADACALIQASIEDATAEFESISTADPAAVVDAMNSAAEGLSETAAQVTNDEVAAILPALQGMFAEIAEVMDAIAQGDATKVDDLSQLATEFQETSDTFQQVCAP
jgi:hypothetical protein